MYFLSLGKLHAKGVHALKTSLTKNSLLISFDFTEGITARSPGLCCAQQLICATAPVAVISADFDLDQSLHQLPSFWAFSSILVSRISRHISAAHSSASLLLLLLLPCLLILILTRPCFIISRPLSSTPDQSLRQLQTF